MDIRRWVCLAAGVFLAGCLFKGEITGVGGTWVYESEFPMYGPPNSKTYVFGESGTVRYEYRVLGDIELGFSGTWSLPGDSLVIQRIACSDLDSAGTLVDRECSGPPEEFHRVYWDGKRIYAINSGNRMHQNFHRK